MPSISVILPVYNQNPEYLKASILSILNQTNEDFELLIIDDGSSDINCATIISDFARNDSRIRILTNTKNSGIVFSLNRGLEEATGEYIARMDSDDISNTKRFEIQSNYLASNPDISLVGSWAEIIDQNSKVIGQLTFPTSSGRIHKTMLLRNPIIHPSWMFRKSILEKVGMYDKKAINCEDYDFLLRVSRQYKISNIPEFLFQYRLNMNGVTFKRNKHQEKYALITRLRAYRRYDYPKWQVIYLIPSFLAYFFLPTWLKMQILKLNISKI